MKRKSPEPRLRRPWLAVALVFSTAAHAALVAALWVEQAPQPEAGAVVDVAIVAESGAAKASRANAAAGAAAKTQPHIVKPAVPPSSPGLVAPRRSSDPPAAPSPPVTATPPPLPETIHAPADASSNAALKRPAAVPPAPAQNPRLAAPPPRAAPPSRAPPPGQDRRPPSQTAAVPHPAPDAELDSAAPGAGPESSASPPRYGLGSAANPIPRYPETARERGWEGLVLLAVSVAADGRAENVSVSRSSGHAVLDEAALEAVRRWRFEPARSAGTPVAGTATVPIRFRLDD